MDKLDEEKLEEKRRIREYRRRNAKLYPVYKMFSWDLLFFYSIEFLFCTITKKVTAPELLIIYGFYLMFRILGQIPAVTITDFIGKRKSIILGNFFIIIFLLILLFLPGALSIVIANFVFAIGYDIKTIAESNLLYDSVSTRGGEGLYSKLDARGGSWYYLLDGITSLTAGYLFVINNYLPIIICLGFVIISTIISFRFRDIYKVENKGITRKKFGQTFKEYIVDLRGSFKFVKKSKRFKALILFQVVFYSLICIVEIYRSDLLVEIGIAEEQFAMIFAALSLIGSASLTFKTTIEKKFKNRTLSLLSITHVLACIIIGIAANVLPRNIVIPIILMLYAVQRMDVSTWYILEYKYIKNFTTEKTRNKITFTYEFIGSIAASIASIIGGIILKYVNVKDAFLIVGIASFVLLLLVLKFMKTRFGLKPEEYQKEDIEFENE